MSDNSLYELQESIQNTVSSPCLKGTENDCLTFVLNCEGCFKEFRSKAEYIVICDDCRLKANGDDEENPVGNIQDALLLEQNLKPDDSEVDDSRETKEDSASTNISCTSDTQGMHTVGDFKVYESPALFDENHPHYKNEIFKSSTDVYNYLSALQASKNVAKMYFNSCSEPIIMEEDAYKKSDSALCSAYFTAVKDKEGDYEKRVYYSYVNLVGFVSKITKKGFLCPSIIVETDMNGQLIDTGERVIRLWRTRCVTAEVWGLIYRISDEKFFLVKQFVRSMRNRFTAIHLPFEYDKTIKCKLEEYIVCHRLILDPIGRPGIPIECMNPQKPDWEILRLSGPPPNGITAYDYMMQMKHGNTEINTMIKAAKGTPKRTLRRSVREAQPHTKSTNLRKFSDLTKRKRGKKIQGGDLSNEDDESDESDEVIFQPKANAKKNKPATVPNDPLKEMQESIKKQEERMKEMEKENQRQLTEQKKYFIDREAEQKKQFETKLMSITKMLKTVEPPEPSSISPCNQQDIMQALSAMKGAMQREPLPTVQKNDRNMSTSSEYLPLGVTGMLISALIKSQSSQISKLERQMEEANQSKQHAELHSFLNSGQYFSDSRK